LLIFITYLNLKGGVIGHGEKEENCYHHYSFWNRVAKFSNTSRIHRGLINRSLLEIENNAGEATMMKDLLCPDCEKPIMSMEKAENLLRTTASRTLVSRCWCGVAYEIRSLKRNVLDVSTSTGKRSEQFIEEGEGQ